MLRQKKKKKYLTVGNRIRRAFTQAMRTHQNEEKNVRLEPLRLEFDRFGDLFAMTSIYLV